MKTINYRCCQQLIFILGIAVLWSSISFAQAPKPDVAAGKAKYNLLCTTCHGATGKGDGAAAAALNPKPRNFQDVAYMSKKTDADLKKVIQQGGAAVGMSPVMPPWGSSLNDQDVANVIAYIRSLGKTGK
ncbi:MAG: hypothetical protein A2W61_06600 [Deltaproteobacteria bacterium RIFCSPLOWO2_01_44_7]|nr:MAG: hypothetical protein A2712_01235 [Deltaproteobacteria bacterium RIFCSPHIGHO2_01_FULL_43_49]OGQ15241.1 MAG: hypothetical protein A3D22_04240 [Deltaproteobacteria bacterium RIFCSPHIGHO2_02_FULL_44_53]OGQ27136.1 MAG: hypothetical protein A3D98_01825 [Deltaproteobacteria bacterium RIFCSPHIGHO2_12_FULL_44_21]OGQ31757.1 MAG: hypothetical protein A2979_05400 [Deltaproteobacteria bacterium RIFCSPLOWO2_01_FULL_45_74]OGQ42146.1 MAG: hypothetical protein A2W61_06600 [Deltaproteobacteria bacterium 